MDLLTLYGGSPANFLGGGGRAQEAQITAAFEILQGDPNVKSILVNIFGGIMKCDVIAGGVVAACRNIGLKKPLVVRLVGTNVEAGSKIIAESEFKETLHSINDLNLAAQKAVELAK